ncbi:MAG TPA: hypothetical protein VME40_15375 [Caulobacteraceae bacterium]|nr:hypothetical protein [Caulobacteraceae bacterium]
MFTTRRGFAALVSGSVAAAGLVGGLPALAQDDDGGGLPNVFFSPHGRPYRAPGGAPYPVVDWFKDANRKGDGKLTLDEFVADAAAFFAVLDLRGGGVLGPEEIAIYEHNIAPEVLGMRVTVYADGRSRVWPASPASSVGARLWLAQYGPMEGGPFGPGGQGPTGGANGPGQLPHGGGDPSAGSVVPPEAQPNSPSGAPQDPDAGAGAAPYSLIEEPEPVTAADPDYLFSGMVRKARFLAHAHDNFALLDQAGSGYLSLASLPRSPVQKLLERGRGRR